MEYYQYLCHIKVIDVILTGTLTTKVIHITTDKAEQLSVAIQDNLNKKGTILSSIGFKDKEHKTILFLVLI